jgi:methionyl-tRNA formyltransferase
MVCVLATSRAWNEVMAERLEERTGYRFHLVTDPESLTEAYLRQIQPRYVFFPHWSSIIPPAIHENYECVIFHMTDLPYGRGGSPLQNLIQQGHTGTKISALRCVEALDAGPIYLKRPLSLEGAASEIFLRAAGVIEEMIEAILREQPVPTPQEGEPVTFQRRKPEDSDLADASVATLNDFFDFIRMLDAEGYPRAFLDVKGHRIELSRVQKESDRLVGTFVIYRRDHLPDDERGGEGLA